MRERAVHLLSRFAFGPTEAEVDRVLSLGEDDWIEEQLVPAADASGVLGDKLAEYQTLDMSAARIRDWAAEGLGVESADDLTEDIRRKIQERRRVPRRELIRATMLRAVYSTRQLEEVLSDFWRNHFNVSYTKGGPADILITDFDRRVVRGHALGTFPGMLHASTKHAAMLHYLDNHLSRRPPTKQELATIERRVRRETDSRQRGEEAAQIAAQRGLNENYARELLELHTLGVDNYYKQKDVIAVAEALTGWTFDGGARGSFDFRFRQDMHISSDKKVLGKMFRADKQDDVAQGEAIVEYLAQHKGTAEFIATKLVRYFVADDAPKSLVKDVASVYRKSDGSIPELVRTIVRSEEFWASENQRAKFRTPFEFMSAALRAAQADIQTPEIAARALVQMGQPLHHCDDPTGWYDTAEAWLDPGVMALRWSFALELAGGSVKGIKISEALFDDLPQEVPRLWQHHLTKRFLPSGAGSRTRNALSSVTDDYLAKAKVADARQLGPQLVGLLLGSPEFQQQ